MGNGASNLVSSLNPCSGSGGYAASRNNPQQSSLNSDLLRESQDQQQQHGGPILDFAIAFLSKILPCSEALLGRLLWVLLWSWKAAPVALYESLFAGSFGNNYSNSKAAIGNTNENNDGDTSSKRGGGWLDSFRNTNPTGDVSQYFQKWWQKTFVIPTAMGFYYFMYDYVSEPILDSVGCCSSEALTTTLGVGMLVLHFLTGVGMHLWQQRRSRRAAVLNEAVATDDYQRQPEVQPSSNQAPTTTVPTLDNNQDHKDWVTMEKAHAAATGAITDYQSNGGNQNKHLPSVPGLLDHIKGKKKKGFWPFGGKKKTSSKFSSNAPPMTEMV